MAITISSEPELMGLTLSPTEANELRSFLDAAVQEAEEVPEELQRNLKNAPSWSLLCDDRLPHYRRDGKLVLISALNIPATSALVSSVNKGSEEVDLEFVGVNTVTGIGAFVLPYFSERSDGIANLKGILADPKKPQQLVDGYTAVGSKETSADDYYALFELLIALLRSPQ